ncbi:MAG TPA: hypothetical protein VFI79_13615 [Gemmatimonadales bacterium]|nr:hypothetical protein [Gemmatimonadales bacterium]
MRSALSAAHDVARPFATVVRAGAAAFLMVLIASCHSETTAPAIPKSLEFSVQPANSDAVSSLGSIRVSALDASGHVITSFLGQVTVALGNNPGTATLGGTKTQSASAGVAVFSNLTINRPGTGYTLVVSVSGGVSQTSAPFNIVPGPPALAVFTVQPNTATAGAAIAPAIQVQVQDAAANVVTTFNSNVTMTIGTNPAGGTLSGTPTVAASAGVATFSNLSIDKAGTGYKLTATAGTGSGQSNAFNVAAGAATQLVFATQPTATAAGSNIAPAVVVTAQDQFGNTATSFANAITMAITGGTGKAGAALSGTKTVTAVNGTATFSTLSIDSAGTGYTLSATASGLVGGFASANFNITPGAATQLVFTGQPATATAGANITPTIVVTARDAKGNTATGFTSAVTLAFGTNAGGGTLSGTTSVNAVAGVASFSTININKSGTGYTLTATSGTLTGATSTGFDIVPGAVSNLVFSVQPSNAAAGAAIAPAIQVLAMDAAGNLVTPFNGNVAMTIGTNPAGGTLSGTATVAAAAGIATFNSLSIDKAGTGYKLTATAAAGSGQSNAFNITAGAATQLIFSTQPTATAAGANVSPAVVVTAQDQFGNNATSFASAITIAITSGTGKAGAALSGTKTVTAVNGVATFSTLSIDSVGTGYTLSATATGLVGGFASATFNIIPGVATQLVFTGPPSNATAGANIAPAIVVTARDAKGNTATGFTGSVTLAFGTNAGGGTLGGTVAVNAVAGIASFSTININKSGTGYTLTAASGTLTGATSTGFSIVAGAATKLVFTSQPTNTLSAATINSSGGVQVTAQDALGNTDLTFTANVTVAFGTNAGSGTLSGTKTVAAASGVATFATLSIDKVGTGYTLAVSATGLTPATSTGFNIINSAATHLVFSLQPTNTVAGVTMTTVTVTALDASNNTAIDFTAAIAIAIGTNPGTGTLSGTKSVTASAGVATFSTLSIDKTGDGYTLVASAGSLTDATSGGFKITPATATHLVFSQQPTNAVAGVAVAPTILVSALDALGNVDTAYTANVDIGIGTNPGAGTLSGLTPVAATNGVASFSNLSINKAGIGYTLHAISGSLTDATSGTFDISPAPLSQLIFTSQPVATPAGAHIAPAVAVSGEDAFGNLVTTFNGNVTVAIGTNGGSPTPGTLSGTLTVAANGGVATFSDLSIDRAGSGYTLTATATGPTPATSAAFGITAGAASKLAFNVQPANAAAGASIAAPIVVLVEDALGNTVPSATDNVTIAIANNAGSPTPGTLSGAANVAAVNGVATFSNLSIDKTGTGYTLSAAATGLTSAISAAFNITANAATKLVFTVEPVTTTAGSGISPAVAVAAQDALGNTDPNFTGNVTVAITGGTGKSGALLSGTLTHAAVAGVATFSGLAIDSAGTAYALTATATSLTSGASSAFNITAGTATKLEFGVQPSNAQAGAALAPTVTVVAKDGQGNIDPTFTASVSLTLTLNPGGATPANATVAAIAGVASFGSLSLDKVGTGYVLQASGGALTSAPSNPFSIAPGPVHHLTFTVQPTNVTAFANISPAVRVTAQDAFNNTVTSFANNVVIAIGTNAGGGTLSGGLTKAAIAGVATYSGLSINATGNGYTLTATAAGIPVATSATFNVIPSVATQLFYTVQPSSATAGASTIGVTVEARDASGQVASSFTGTVTLAITAGTGTPGATLTGTKTAAAVAGVATFSGLSIDKAGSNYKLTATDVPDAVASATSGFFSINHGTATQLVYGIQPSTTGALATIAPQVELDALDANGNLVTDFVGNVTLAINNNPGTPSAGTLSGTLTKAVTGGVAAFNDLSINNPGVGYTLDATSSLPTVTSTGFDITASTANHLVITAQPTTTTAGAAISAFTLEARDASNALLTGFNGNVTVQIAGGTGSSGATLSGTTTKAAVNGVVSFTDLSINKKGTGYKLSATTAGLTGATSSTFAINAGTASQVSFLVDPPSSSTSSGVALAPAIQADVEDALGNRVTTYNGTVTVAIFSNPGGGTLSGSTSATSGNGQLVNGVATFSDLSIDLAGVGYRLQVTGTGLSTGDISTAFTIIAGPADHLIFTVAPSNRTAGQSISPAIRVTAFDALGNLVTAFTNNVDIAITSGTGTAGATLSGTASVAAVSGVAQFSGLSIDKAGAGYTLSATASGVTGTTSATFNITPAVATQLIFTVQPTNTAVNASITPPVVVTAEDQFGNVDTTYAANITTAMGTNAGPVGTVLSGTKTVAAAHGVATFSDLSINNAGVGFTITAQSGALPLKASSAFNIF